MYCRHCGKEIAGEADFCTSCGKKQKEGEAAKTIYKHELTRLKPPKEPKNPKATAALGFFLSWIFLGPVGYIYLGQWNWFWLTLIIQIFVYPLTFFTAYLLLPIVYGIHQYQMAKDVNDLLAKDREAGRTGDTGQTGTAPSAEPEA